MELVRESVVQLIAENDTLQAERDSRLALEIVRVVESGLQSACQGVRDGVGKVENGVHEGVFHEKCACCRKLRSIPGEPQFTYSGLALKASNACMDEATWEETKKNSWTGNRVWEVLGRWEVR